MPVHNVHPLGVAPLEGQPPPHPASLLREAGLLLQIVFSPPDALSAALVANSLPIPTGEAGLALIDTGATFSGIHEPIAKALGLQSTGTMMLGGVAGSKEHDIYQVKASFPGSPLPDLELTVVGVNLEGQAGRIALVGMDLLCQCVLIYNGPQGSFTLAF